MALSLVISSRMAQLNDSISFDFRANPNVVIGELARSRGVGERKGRRHMTPDAVAHSIHFANLSLNGVDALEDRLRLRRMAVHADRLISFDITVYVRMRIVASDARESILSL